ncbi:putative leucine-rich repeat-containing protein DDB_G0290503 isoform X3 [Hydra vulgaris]|uniref:Leucine-rich repeat-containing protein DDB_G0290503 isoform X3 n=1 Tax=Hydra vulgaris TaxID=6087 RepID=A0ABM4BCU9_HYDVU
MASCYGEFLEDDYSGGDASFIENKCINTLESSRINCIKKESCDLLKPESLMNFSIVTSEHGSCLSEINFEISEKDSVKDCFSNDDNDSIKKDDCDSRNDDGGLIKKDNDSRIEKVQKKISPKKQLNDSGAFENEKIILLAKLSDAKKEKENILEENNLLKENEEFLKNSLMNLTNLHHQKVEELNIKSQLLEAQTNELNKAILRQYKLEQEVMFYKLDAKCQDFSFDNFEQDHQTNYKNDAINSDTFAKDTSFKIHNISEKGAVSSELLFNKLTSLFKKILKNRIDEELLKEIKEFLKYLQSRQIQVQRCLLEENEMTEIKVHKEKNFVEDECFKLKDLMKKQDDKHAFILKKCNAEKEFLLKEVETWKTQYSTASNLNNQIMSYVSHLTKSINSTGELVFPHLIQNPDTHKLLSDLCECFKEKFEFLHQSIRNQANKDFCKEKEDLHKAIKNMKEEFDLKESNIRILEHEISLLKLQFSTEKNEIEKKHLFLLNEYDAVANAMKQKIEELEEENKLQSTLLESSATQDKNFKGYISRGCNLKLKKEFSKLSKDLHYNVQHLQDLKQRYENAFENLTKNSEKTIDALNKLWLQIQNDVGNNQLTCRLFNEITKIKNMLRKQFLQVEPNKCMCLKQCMISDVTKNKKSYGSNASVDSEETEIVKVHEESVSPSIDMNNNNVRESKHPVLNELVKQLDKKVLLNNFKQSHNKLCCQLNILESKYSTK